MMQNLRRFNHNIINTNPNPQWHSWAFWRLGQVLTMTAPNKNYELKNIRIISISFHFAQ